jgi:hypothetical protein
MTAVLSAVSCLNAQPARDAPGALYVTSADEERARARREHARNLATFVRRVGEEESSRYVAVEALREALARVDGEGDEAVRDALTALLDGIQGQGHLSVAPALLPPPAAAVSARAHASPALGVSRASPPNRGGGRGVLVPLASEGSREDGDEGWRRGEAEDAGEAVGRAGEKRERKRVEKKEAKREEAGNKERVRDKKKVRKPMEGDTACVEAWKLRALSKPEDVFAVLLPDSQSRELTLLTVRETVKALKLPAGIQESLWKAMGWDKKQGKKVSDLEFVQVFSRGWQKNVGADGGGGGGEEVVLEREAEEVEAAVDASVMRRRELAAAMRKRLGDADKMLKKKVVADLEEALAKCAEIEQLSAPPPGQVSSPAFVGWVGRRLHR